MKKYINRFFMLATLLVAGMAFVSCEKENGPVEGTFTMSVNAVKGGSNASKALTVDGTAINATWTENDVVKVYKSGVEVGSLTAASSGASTKLNGSITGSIAQGDNLTLEFLSPDYQRQDGTLDYIAAHCDYAVANVTVASISGGEIRITGNSATFENQQAIVKFTLSGQSIDATHPLVIKKGVNDVVTTVTPASSATEVYVAMPPAASSTYRFIVTTDDNKYIKSGTAAITAGKYYQTTLDLTARYPLALSSATVDDLGSVIDTEGKIHLKTTATTASGKTALAMIAYLGSETGVAGYTHGLALALSDKGQMNWSTAAGASGAAAHTPAAPTPTTSSWMLPSQDQWNKMIDACKNVLGTQNDYRDLRDGFSSVGGSNLQSASYWSSTATSDPNYALVFPFGSGNWYSNNIGWGGFYVRACLAF